MMFNQTWMKQTFLENYDDNDNDDDDENGDDDDNGDDVQSWMR